MQVVLADGARVVATHEIPEATGSVIVIDCSVVWPVLVTVNEYGIVAPTAEYPVEVVDFAMESEDVSGEFVSVQVMSSFNAGVIANGTIDEPLAGRTVEEPAVAFTQVTAERY